MIMYSDETTWFGGSCLGESSQDWELDIPLFNEKVAGATDLINSAPKKCEDEIESFANIKCFPLSNLDWMSNQVDLSVFDEFVNIPIVEDSTIIHEQSSCGNPNSPLAHVGNNCSAESIPFSPISCDSGISSPSTSLNAGASFSECGSPSSSQNDSPLFSHDNFLMPDLSNCNVFEEEAPSGSDAAITDDMLKEFGIELTEETTENLEIPELHFPLTNSTVNATWLGNDPVAIKIALPSEESIYVPKDTSEISKLLISDIPSVSSESLTSSTSPRPTKRSKITNVQESKQRKRGQNRNAARRYREKKRQEADERQSTFNDLHNKNKTLKDQVTQITREIDYLKELMIEVYTIKGLIP